MNDEKIGTLHSNSGKHVGLVIEHPSLFLSQESHVLQRNRQHISHFAIMKHLEEAQKHMLWELDIHQYISLEEYTIQIWLYCNGSF